MTPTDDLWLRAEELFHRVMEAPEAEREALARRLAGEDTALAGEVLSLLGASATFLAKPAVDVASVWSALQAEEAADPLIGQRVGEYEIRSRLGAGGMGVVYLAHQDSPSREVALKLMRPGAMAPALTRRFEDEAQILGRLQHPGIAQVYGAGRLRGPGGSQPYFAMEYVRGEPLLDYVKSRGLGVPERVSLVAAVCDAVQHAHTKGVIHRDLKPANILVTEPENSTGTSGGGRAAQPKVLDFGVARVTESDLQRTAQTTVGEIIGTLPYMSPEQVRGDSAEIDTRTDVYALGVILYEVLSGRLPLDLSGKTLAQAVPLILEKEPAPLGTLERGLRGDLEVIAAKAMEKDKSRRYQSAIEIAEDLRRSLADAPILARPASTVYQLRKFARRNRALVGGVMTALVLLVAGVVGTSVGLVRAQAREREATIAAAQASRTVDFLTTILTSANPTVSRGRDLTVKELIDEAAARANAELADQPEVEFRTRLALSRTYLSLNTLDAARGQAERAKVLAERLYGARSVEYSEGLGAVAAAAETREKSEASVAAAREVLDLRLSLLPAEHRLVALARVAVAKALSNLSKFEEAEAELRPAYEAMRAQNDPGFAFCASMLAELMMRAPKGARLAEAEELLKPTLERLRSRGPQAEADVATTLLAMGSVYTRQKRHEEAERVLTEVVAIRTRIFPPTHPATFSSRLRLIQAQVAQQRFEAALADCQALVDQEEKVLGINTPDFINACVTLGRIREELKDLPAAAAAYGRAAEGCKLLQDRMQVMICLQMQVRCLVDANLHDQAEAPLRAALEISRASGRKGVTRIPLLRELASVLAAGGRHEERLAVVREALEYDASAPSGPELTLELKADAAAALVAAGKADAGGEAEGLLRQVLEGWATHPDRPERSAEAAARLAELLERTGRGDEAGRVRAEHPPPPGKPKEPERPAIHGVPAV